MGNHIVIQSLHHLAGRQHVHPGGVCLNDQIRGSFVGRVDLLCQGTVHGPLHQITQFLADLYRGPPVDLNRVAVLNRQGVVERRNSNIDNTKFLAHHAYLRSSAFISALASLVL